METKVYSYEGAVLYFDKVYAKNWYGVTTAKSEKQAKRFLNDRCKEEFGFAKNAKISIAGMPEPYKPKSH